MILFFDTETNGLPLNYKAPVRATENWPRVIQLAWALISDDGSEVHSHACSLIRPHGWEIPKKDFWIKHGYSTEKSAAEGIPMKEALLPFKDAIEHSHTIVAHNMDFDFPIIGAEMIRYSIRCENFPRKLCTMKMSTNLCQLPGGKNGEYKWPKLEELHSFLFLEPFTGAHDALNDVLACAKCFFELQRRQLIPAA